MSSTQHAKLTFFVCYQKLDDCYYQNCLNGGTCNGKTFNGMQNAFHACDCEAGWRGVQCEISTTGNSISVI